jgi:hypothetical protein
MLGKAQKDLKTYIFFNHLTSKLLSNKFLEIKGDLL